MMRDEESTKYCYHCGKVIPSGDIRCKFCGHDLTVYKKQRVFRCKYCLNDVPVEANFCKVCCMKNTLFTLRKDEEMLQQLKIAADMYQQKKDIQNNDKHVEHVEHGKYDVNVFYCYGKFKKAKKIFCKTGNKSLNIQTFEYGQDNILYDDIISCHKLDKKAIKNEFDIEIKTDGSSLLNSFIVIKTIKGNIVIENDNNSEKIVKNIYYYLRNNVVEFKNCFYNGNYEDEITNRYNLENKKEAH